MLQWRRAGREKRQAVGVRLCSGAGEREREVGVPFTERPNDRRQRHDDHETITREKRTRERERQEVSIEYEQKCLGYPLWYASTTFSNNNRGKAQKVRYLLCLSLSLSPSNIPSLSFLSLSLALLFYFSNPSTLSFHVSLHALFSTSIHSHSLTCCHTCPKPLYDQNFSCVCFFRRPAKRKKREAFLTQPFSLPAITFFVFISTREYTCTWGIAQGVIVCTTARKVSLIIIWKQERGSSSLRYPVLYELAFLICSFPARHFCPPPLSTTALLLLSIFCFGGEEREREGCQRTWQFISLWISL